MTRPDDAPRQPDGPTPDREQLPLPRRQRQSHLEPQLREPDNPGTGIGTPFTAFTADAATGEVPVVPTGRGETPAGTPTDTSTGAPADRAAAFRAGARRGDGTAHPYRRGPGPHRTDR